MIIERKMILDDFVSAVNHYRRSGELKIVSNPRVKIYETSKYSHPLIDMEIDVVFRGRFERWNAWADLEFFNETVRKLGIRDEKYEKALERELEVYREMLELDKRFWRKKEINYSTYVRLSEPLEIEFQERKRELRWEMSRVVNKIFEKLNLKPDDDFDMPYSYSTRIVPG